MPNRKLLNLACALAGVALTRAGAASGANSPAAADDGNVVLLAIGGIVLIAALAWRAFASRRAKEPDPAAFMTLDQITRLETPGNDSPFARTVQPKPISSPTPGKPGGGKTVSAASDPYMSELEKHYPRIVEKLVMLWPDAEAENYLQGLSFDERGDREGFDREVAAEIMLLYGVKLKEHKDIWL